MRKPQKPRLILSSLGVMMLAIIAVSGVTFAALQSQQNVLTGNTVETATANLGLSTDGINYGDSRVGFDFNNLMPGGAAMPIAGHGFYLKNAGGTALALKLMVSSTPSNPNGIDLSKVNILLTTVGSGNPAQSFSLQSLATAASSGGLPITGSIASGTTGQYKLQIQMAADAVTGQGAQLGGIDFAFGGVAQSN